MNERTAIPRVETLALEAVIQEAVAAAEASINDGPFDRMVFLGNHHQSIPVAVVKDPVLEPVDKLVWMVIMLAVQDTGSHTAFPGYDAIGRMANVASRSTIARAIAILRATRWLTLCARRRRLNGRFRGHVYALHDEPIPLVDALHLDSHYLSFLRNALDHGHRRVAAVARAVLDSIDDDIKGGGDACAQPHPIERRLRSAISNDGTVPGRSFSLTRDSVQRLRHDLRQPHTSRAHRDQNSNTADRHVQISNLSSSSNNKNTTTTNMDNSKFDTKGESDAALIFPKRLSDDHRNTAMRYLETLRPEQRQPVLDELEGRFNAETKGMKPVYDELSFLQSLCNLTRRGKFRPNLGLRVREARDNQAHHNEIVLRRAAERPAKETGDERQVRVSESRARLAELRKVLVGAPVIKNQNVMAKT